MEILWILISFVLILKACSLSDDCGFYLAPSRIVGAGRGIVAGRDYEFDDELETIPTIQIPKRVSQNSQLKHYVFATNDDRYDLIIFGSGSIYNHHPNRSVVYSWTDDEEEDLSLHPQPFVTVAHNDFKVIRKVKLGDELLNFYGDSWFEDSGAPSVDPQLPSSIPLDELKQYGHCMTDVFINESTLLGAGLGVFANRDFYVGEEVTITPVLALPKLLVDGSERYSVIKNYCLTTQNSTVVLFPLAHGAIINHNAPEQVNVDVGWHDWSPAVEALSAKYRREGDPEPDPSHNLRLADKLAMSVQELSEAPFGQLDIAYKATRPIQRGEELFLNYGAEWQAAWDAYASKIDQTCSNGENGEVGECAADERPNLRFRQYIRVPADLFPAHWN